PNLACIVPHRRCALIPKIETESLWDRIIKHLIPGNLFQSDALIARFPVRGEGDEFKAMAVEVNPLDIPQPGMSQELGQNHGGAESLEPFPYDSVYLTPL